MLDVGVNEDKIARSKESLGSSNGSENCTDSHTDRLDGILAKVEGIEGDTKPDVSVLICTLEVLVCSGLITFHSKHLDGFIVD